jgi:hypothetical protein
MNKLEFLARLAEALDHDGVIEVNQNVDSLPEWDSLGILSVIELLADLNIKVKPDALKEIQYIAELVEVARKAIDE